jgi:ribosomal-protein-alanine N-acetyltransferase
MIILHTQRLVLRPLAASDSDDVFEARRDRDVMAFWDGRPDTTRAETSAIVGLWLDDVASGAAEYWTIRLRTDESFVGVCDLSEIRDGQSADAGFMLLRRCWGSGFGSEAVRCLLSYARSIGLRVVTARIHHQNTRSRSLLLRTGFQFVDDLPRYEIRPGVFRDCVRFEIKLQNGD